MTNPSYRRGMTMVEMMLVVVIIGMLAAFILPAFNQAVLSRKNAQCATKLRTAVAAFELYRSETGGYPADQIVPSETTVAAMQAYYFPYFNIDWWGAATELGGRWDWDVGYNFKVSVSIYQPSASQEQLTDFDKLVDDGNLSTGFFRKVNTQYHYIIEY